LTKSPFRISKKQILDTRKGKFASIRVIGRQATYSDYTMSYDTAVYPFRRT